MGLGRVDLGLNFSRHWVGVLGTGIGIGDGVGLWRFID